MDTQNDNRIKTYVDVTVDFDSAGDMKPRSIIFNDQSYEIDKVSKPIPAASLKAGGQGDRYTITVLGQQSYLYFERNATLSGCNIGRWFVEEKQRF